MRFILAGGVGARRDVIAVVEACYELGGTEEEWLGRVAGRVFEVVRPDDGLLAYHVDFDAAGCRIRNPVQAGAPPLDMVERIRSMAALLERRRTGRAGLIERAQAAIYERVLRSGLTEAPDRLLHSELNRLGPEWMYNLGAPVQDVFALRARHVDGHGATGFFGGLQARRTLRSAEREMFLMLSAHIKAGLRLRRTLPEAATIDAPPEGAVLTPSGRILHAEGAARDATEALSESAHRIDHARCATSGRSERALEVWTGLIEGTWSLVERFDVDGRRMMLAHRNPEAVGDPRGLSPIERRVAALAAFGYADKLIAYHLGLSEGTISSHLSRVRAKLGVASRVELVQRLGPRRSRR